MNNPPPLDTMTDERHEIGGNNPPTDAETIGQKIEAAAKEVFARATDLREGADDPERLCTITTDGQERATIMFQKQIGECRKSVEEMRKKLKSPYDDAGRIVQDYFLPVLKILGEAKDKTQGILTERMVAQKAIKDAEAAEERRIAAEKAAAAQRLEDEARTVADEARAAAAKKSAQKATKAADKKSDEAGRSRSGYGQTASLRTVVTFEITNRMAVPMEFWTLDEAALGAAIRGGRHNIPGVEVKETQQAGVR